MKQDWQQLLVRTDQQKIVTKDKFSIYFTCYSSGYNNNQVIIIGSATGVQQEYYRAFSRFMATKGYTVYTFDYRGVGKSRPDSLKNFPVEMNEWGKYDLDAMIRYVRHKHPAGKLIYIGHSISGQLLTLTPESAHVAKVILVASQDVNWRLWPLYARFVYAFLVYVLMPVTSHLAGYYPGKSLKVFCDLPKGVALEWARWCRSRKGMFSHHSDTYLQQLRVPLLGIGFSDDVIAPFKPMNTLLKKYSQASVTRWQYKPGDLGTSKIGHFGFFRSGFKDLLWYPVLEWMEQTDKFAKPLMGVILSDQMETSHV